MAHRVATTAKPAELRWACHNVPGGQTAPMVLQQAWVTEWTVFEDGRAMGAGVDVEWRDVPIWQVPYTAAK